jgi:single-strand DNA-binding protein
MANDLNQCSFIGRLGKDVELRFTPSGEAVANIALAVGSEWRDKSGNKQEATEWVNVSVYGKLAEVCAEYLGKGYQVYVQGRLKTEKWQDKTTGADRYSTRINADKVQFIGEKKEKAQPAPHQEQHEPPMTDFDAMPDDIPF